MLQVELEAVDIKAILPAIIDFIVSERVLIPRMLKDMVVYIADRRMEEHLKNAN